MKCSIFLGLAAFIFSSSVLADDRVRFEPEPAWVVQRPVSALPESKRGQSPFLLLQDNQARFGTGMDEFYTNYAIQVRNAADLQGAGNVTLWWHPDTQSLQVHKIEIIRNNLRINAIANSKALTIIRREQNLEAAALDGALTATLQLEDLRVGDIVHVAFTISSADPVLQGRSMGSLALARPDAVERAFFRAVWPKSKQIAVKSYPGLEGSIRPLDTDSMTFEFEATHVQAPIAPANAPMRFQTIAQADFSEFKSYNEVSRLFYPLYAKAVQLAPGSEIHAAAERIRAANPDDRSRALAALQFVESNIRYLFIGFNDGGYVPAPAELTWSRKYGDCKGKTVLLLALLNALNIKATPVLLDSGGGDGLDEKVPSPGRFDHVLVRAEINGTDYWLDATRLGDYQLERPEFNVRFVLPLTPDGANLVAVPRPDIDFYQFESRASYDASRGIEHPAKAHIEHIFRGDRALAKGLELDSVARQGLDRVLRYYWKNEINWLRPSKVSYQFDRLRGVTTLSVDGQADLNWAKSNDGAELFLGDSQVGWDTSYAREPGPSPDAPYSVSFPFFRRWLVSVLLPGDGDGFEVVNGEDMDKVVAGVRFIRKNEAVGNIIEVDTIEQSVKGEFPESEAVAAELELREMASFDVMIRKLPFGKDANLLSQAQLEDALSKVRAGDFSAAKDVLGKAISDPRFLNLTPLLQAQGYLALCGVSGYLKDYQEVERALKLGYATGHFKQEFQDMELKLRQFQDDMNAVAIILSKIIPERGLKATQYSDQDLRQVVQEASGEPARDLLQALLKSKWRPEDPFKTLDSFWVKLAALEMGRGDIDAAAAALSAVESPRDLIAFKVDHKYAKVVLADPSKFNLDQAFAKRLEDLQGAVKAHPDRLTGIITLAAGYRSAGRAEDSLKLAKDAIAKARAAPDGQPAFIEQEKYLPWVYEDVGRALFQLGRNDEGLSAFERAAHRATGEGIDIGLSLNLADKLVDLGRASEALDETAEIGMSSLSAYGKMVRQQIVVCANAQLARKDKAQTAIVYMKTHASDGAGPYRDALLCLGDLDKVAELVMAQLESPDQRQDVLKALQDYPMPPHSTDWNTQQIERLRAVRARADVQATLAKYGKIEHFNVY